MTNTVIIDIVVMEDNVYNKKRRKCFEKTAY